MSLFKRIMKYVWPQMRKYKALFLTVFFLSGLRVLLSSVATPYYFKKIIDALSNAGIDHSLVYASVLSLVFIIIGISFSAQLVARVTLILFATFQMNMVRALRNFAFEKLETNSASFFANTFAGSLVTKSRRFVNAFDLMFDIVTYNFLRVFVVFVGVLIILLNQSTIVALIFISWAICHLVLISFFIKKKMQYDAAEAEQDSRISGRLADVFSNILAVKFFSARKSEIASFGEYVEEGRRRTKKAWFFGIRLEIIQGIFMFFVHGIMLYVLVRLWGENKISTGTVVLVQTYMVIIFEQIWDFGSALVKFMKAAADMKEMVDIFDVVPDILDPKKPEKLRAKEGHIVFDKVYFKYALGGHVLENFNLDIKPGERVGIVGHSGAGKSTITKLLLRFNDVTEGSITIDGQDIRNITQDDLRNVISYVPQEPILFHRPIRENISYGKPDATEEEIIEVAKKAHAHEFISLLPHGYDTLVGERGVKLSGGERQRVAIARAMLKHSPILMLDEATSSLDSISESYIQDAFNELMKDKTVIVIAHRLSTIKKMDRIIVLDKGKISEAGTHEDLINKKGLYEDLWQHQTGFLEE